MMPVSRMGTRSVLLGQGDTVTPPRTADNGDGAEDDEPPVDLVSVRAERVRWER